MQFLIPVSTIPLGTPKICNVSKQDLITTISLQTPQTAPSKDRFGSVLTGAILQLQTHQVL